MQFNLPRREAQSKHTRDTVLHLNSNSKVAFVRTFSVSSYLSKRRMIVGLLKERFLDLRVLVVFDYVDKIKATWCHSEEITVVWFGE